MPAVAMSRAAAAAANAASFDWSTGVVGNYAGWEGATRGKDDRMMRRGHSRCRCRCGCRWVDTEAAAEMVCERVDHSITHSLTHSHSLYILEND